MWLVWFGRSMEIKSLVKNWEQGWEIFKMGSDLRWTTASFRRHWHWTVPVVDLLVIEEDYDIAYLHQVGEWYWVSWNDLRVTCHLTSGSGLWSEIVMIESLIIWFLILNISLWLKSPLFKSLVMHDDVLPIANCSAFCCSAACYAALFFRNDRRVQIRGHKNL